MGLGDPTNVFINLFLNKMTVMTQTLFNFLLFMESNYASRETNLLHICSMRGNSVIIQHYQFLWSRKHIFFPLIHTLL